MTCFIFKVVSESDEEHDTTLCLEGVWINVTGADCVPPMAAPETDFRNWSSQYGEFGWHARI